MLHLYLQAGVRLVGKVFFFLLLFEFGDETIHLRLLKLLPVFSSRVGVDRVDPRNPGSWWNSPRRPAGRRAAACPTARCACPRRLPWLLDVGGGEALQQGREDPSGSVGRAAGREREAGAQVTWSAGTTKYRVSSGNKGTTTAESLSVSSPTNLPCGLQPNPFVSTLQSARRLKAGVSGGRWRPVEVGGGRRAGGRLKICGDETPPRSRYSSRGIIPV